MSKLRAFFVGLPAACGVHPEIAHFFEKMNGGLFDHEKANPGSVLARKAGQSTVERLAIGFDGWRRVAAKPEAVEYALELAVYAADKIAFEAKGIVPEQDLELSKRLLLVDEPRYPEIAALLTVEEASALGQWS